VILYKLPKILIERIRILKLMTKIFAIIVMLIILFSYAHAEERISHSVSGNIDVWRIDEPNVRQSRTTYEQIRFHQGDFITLNAGGIVNTGGWGNTCKRYVDPSGEILINTILVWSMFQITAC